MTVISKKRFLLPYIASILIMIILISPSCNAKCDNYYIIMNKNVFPTGDTIFQPFPMNDFIWTETEATGGTFDINCVINLSCDRSNTTWVTKMAINNNTGNDTRYNSPKLPAVTVPDDIKTTESTTEWRKYSIEPTEHSTPRNDDPGETTITPEMTTLTEYSTETTNINPVNINPEGPPVEVVTDSKSIAKSKEVIEKMANKIVNNDTTDGNNNTLSVHNDDRNKTDTVGGASQHLKEPGRSKQLAMQVVAGVGGAGATGLVIFGLQKLIQSYLQSGVYRIPGP